MQGQSYVYILASKIGGTLYVGATTHLVARVGLHKTKSVDGFTKKYNVDRLVYFEVFADIQSAAARERPGLGRPLSRHRGDFEGRGMLAYRRRRRRPLLGIDWMRMA